MNQHAHQDPTAAASPAITYRRNPLRLMPAVHSTIDAITGEKFVTAMRGAAAGVNIVTTDGPAGRWGMTVSAFSSVSAEPPTVLVCINRRSPLCAAIVRNRRFCINILSAEQRPLAETFSGHPQDGDPYDFDAATWTKAATGAPLLTGSVASFDCKLGTAVDAGTHAIFVGSVCSVKHNDASPLLYTNRAYRRACCDA
jgi:flavin reductase